MLDEAFHLSHRQAQRLVDGTSYEHVRDSTGRWSWVIETVDKMGRPVEDQDPHATWAGLLSYLETQGELEWDGAMLVMDLERAQHLLSRHHPEAAAVIAARVMNDHDDDEMDLAFPKGKGRSDWRRLRSKACAWFSVYVSGGSIEAAERAYRNAR